ncbi:DUF2877 domain-containing protein [Intrasporangium calvum]|uniref:DUF2877 domain-containing protein n=1 Tax=Intrasporangium calvum (strain ATCC 23552 / DSM 43043 / JCM 3097 / NBRC 12989 / NCIMB 10167 / NRRL B-3866 / 7 KIP) TaxID=710696 RepID=E6SDZ5_INTC7|nr:DUF2877 domain-containing protein [Intrasporangium calvum]ADU47608.1 hypothetical protein Intca_1087 [Intrasporangium calvum DSM 43043]
MLTAAARPSWPAAVSPLVLGAVAGPRRAARVLGVFPTCVYVGLGPHDAVLALLARDALLQPIGLRLPTWSPDVRWDVSPGDEVDVGEGRVRLARADVVAARVQRLPRVAPPPPDQPPHRPLDCALDCTLDDTDCALHCALDWPPEAQRWLAALAQDLAAAALTNQPVAPFLRSLVGAGRGLTPSGDDAIAGVVLALRAAGRLRAVDRVGSHLGPLLDRTTSVSAALLRAAVEGYAVPEVVALLAAPGPSPDPRLLERVLAIGHSSGRDLLAGITGARRALSAHRAVGHRAVGHRAVGHRTGTVHASAQEGVLHA